MKTCSHTNWCACTKYRKAPDAEPLGLSPELEESIALHLRVSDLRREGNRSTSEDRRMDRARLGRNDEWCFDTRFHGEPCPFPCDTCDHFCRTEYRVRELAPINIRAQIQIFLQQD